MPTFWRFLRWLSGSIAGLIVLGTQVGPKEAASRLSEWASVIGIEQVPPWLASQAVDKWAFWVGLLVIAILVGWPWYRKLQAFQLKPTRPPPDALPPRAHSPERIIVPDEITPSFLTGFYGQHTAVQADQLAAAYIGKWMNVSGPIYNVSKRYDDLSVTIGISATNDTFIAMSFDMRWKDRLSVLTKNMPIAVLGQIEHIQPSQLNLHHCELLETPVIKATENAHIQYSVIHNNYNQCVFEIKEPKPAAVEKAQSAYLKMDAVKLELINAYNVVGISEDGDGQISVTFAQDLKNPSFTSTYPSTTCTSLSSGYATLKVDLAKGALVDVTFTERRSNE